MQKRYLIDVFSPQIQGQTQSIAESHGCYLLERPDSAKGYGIGDEKRFDVVRRSDNVPIVVIGLTQERQGTHLLITHEPHCERQGESFDHDAFADFAGLALASLNRDWKIQTID